MKAKDIDTSNFRKNLIKFRKIRGLSQVKLAELSGVSRRVIAYYETKNANPPLKSIIAIANALNISILDLIGSNSDKIIDLFENTDTRTLKKIMLINNLSKKDRSTIYNMIDAMFEKKKSSKQKVS